MGIYLTHVSRNKCCFGGAGGFACRKRRDGNAGEGVSVTQNSAVELGGDLGVLGPPNETGVLNGGFGISCSVNSSAEGRLATLNGKEGATEFDRSTNKLE